MEVKWRKMNGFVEVLKALTPQQLDFVAARLSAKNDKEAAESTGISPDVVYNWRNKEQVNLAVKLGKVDGVLLGREKLRRIVIKAVQVLEEEMEPGKKQRLAAAREVLDRAGISKLRKVALTDPTGEESYDPVGADARKEVLGRLLRINAKGGVGEVGSKPKPRGSH